MSAETVEMAGFCVDIGDFLRGRYIDKGSFGVVYEGEDTRKEPHSRVALKVMLDPIPEDRREQMQIMRELKIMATIKPHPAILPLIGFNFGDKDSNMMIVTPFMGKGSLRGAITAELKKTPIEGWTPTKKSINVFGIVAGMAHVHAAGIIHRDLKPQNVLLNDNFEPCICDFGISRSKDGLVKTMVRGTAMYMAPEMFSDAYDEQYTQAVDVYSFAILLYMMFTNVMVLDSNPRPVTRQEVMLRWVERGARPVRIDSIPDFYWELMHDCWQPAYGKRPTFVEIMKRLSDNQEKYAFAGTDMAELSAYERKMYRECSRAALDGKTPSELMNEIFSEPETPEPVLPRVSAKSSTASLSKMFA